MAGITLADLDNILEKIIRQSVEDQLYNQTILFNMFGGYNFAEKSADKKKYIPRLNMGVLKTSMDNQNFYIPILTGHSSGAVAISESGTLNRGKSNTGQAEVSAVYQTGTFEISKQTLAVKDEGVAVRQLDFFMNQNTLAMGIDLNRQCYGAGDSIIGTANTSGSSSTDFVFKASANDDIDFTDYTPIGTNIIIGTNTYVTVSDIVAKNEITLSSAISWNAGDNVYKADGGGVKATEITGLKLAVSNSGTYETIATSNRWTAGYYDNPGSSTALSKHDMNAAFGKANKIGNIKYILMNISEFNAYGALLTDLIRFDYKEVLGGGWKGLDFMGGNAQVVLDYGNWTDDRVYFLSPQSWSLGEMNPFEWERGESGRGILQRITGSLNYEAVGTWFGQLLCFARGANGVLANRVG